MEQERIQALVKEPWTATCRRNKFCFHCWSSFCDHCCPEHWHRHHPAEAGRDRVATIGLIRRGNPAVLAKHPVGSGYDWKHIQRVSINKRNWILLNPRVPPLQGHWLGPACVNCNQRIVKSAAMYCCTMCKHNQVHVGRGRDMIQALAAGDYNQALRCDRFCTICMSSFSSGCCALHIERHHTDANALGVWIIVVVHVDGWAAVAPSALIPNDVLHDVQVLHADGAVLYPLRRLEVAAAVHHLGDVPSQDNCDAPGCHEMIPEQPRFCSLRCKAAVVWAA